MADRFDLVGSMPSNFDFVKLSVARRAARTAVAVAAIVALACTGTSRADTIPHSTLVQFNTTFGTFQVDLFDQVAGSNTVFNFLQYVDVGGYNNTIFHRTQQQSTQGIGIVQGGGYTTNGTSVSHISTLAGIALQYKLDNSIGTIAMARTGDTVAGTTSEWFFNTSDNTQTLGAGNSGGYAVFGQVMAGGMSVVNSVYNLPQGSFGGLTNVPLRNWTQGTTPTSANLAFTTSVTTVNTHAAFQNPITANDVDNSGTISAVDANQVINSLLKGGGPHAATTFFGTKYEYVDVTGDGLVSALDAVKVINYLIHNPPQAQSSIMAAPLTAHAPEPSTLALGAMASLGFAAFAVRTRRRRRTSHGR